MGEGVDFHNFLIAGLDRGGRLEALLFGDNINRFDETVALAGVYAIIEGDLLALGERWRRGFGEIGLMSKRRIDGGRDEGAAGNAGQERAGEPAQGDFPPIEGNRPCAAGLDRRIYTKFDDAKPGGPQANAWIRGA